MNTTGNYTVNGMTCSHCVLSVRDEVVELPGIASVEVDLDTGAMVVTGTDVDDAAIAAAVSDAGYELAP